MNTRILDKAAIKSFFPKRPANSHKGNYGKILLLCGSVGYTGAPALAAMGALRTGAGLVYLGVPGAIYEIEAGKLLEPVVFPVTSDEGAFSEESQDEITEKLTGMDAVLIGPGIGRTAGAQKAVFTVLSEFKGPVVLDADGINAICRHKDVVSERAYPTILTPHEGEFQRLGGRTASGRRQAAEEMARELHAVILLKGYRTIITDGAATYENPTGNPGMAAGGSGDILSGIIVSLLGQGIAPLEAAACGAWIHGAAGDHCAEALGEYGMLPGDMLQALPHILK